MKKIAIVSSLILTAALIITPAQAGNSTENSTEKEVGFFSGAIAGAIVGGPIGFFVGGISGAMMGEEVAKANQLEGVKSELTLQQNENSTMNQELNALQQDNNRMGTQLASTTQWLTQGLTMSLMFTTNSTELSNNDSQMISRVSKILMQSPDLKIRLDGYADPRGTKDENMALSKERAQAVSDAFIDNGVQAHQLITQPHGESNSIAKQDKPLLESGNLLSQQANEDNYALDRRVTVSFVTSKDDSVAQN
jgi:outer membrane protein OmpA-like peptidoglycan-associated protein